MRYMITIFLIMNIQQYIHAFKKGYIDIVGDRLSDCPNIEVTVAERLRNSPTVCGSICQSTNECTAFGFSNTGCVLYTFIMASDETEIAGNTVVYIKNNHKFQNVVRGLIPNPVPTFPGAQGVNFITMGSVCQEDLFKGFCNDPGDIRDIRIDLMQRYHIVEVIFTTPLNQPNDYTKLAVHIGDSGTGSDPVFADDFVVVPGVPSRITKEGFQTGRYITIIDYQMPPEFLAICISLFEAYGYPE